MIQLLAVMVALLLTGPLLIPIPPLQDTLPESALFDRDSNMIEIDQLKIHYKELGTGEPAFILLHGFGASTFSWRHIMEPLAEYGRVIAYDRPGFGLTSRPMPGACMTAILDFIADK